MNYNIREIVVPLQDISLVENISEKKYYFILFSLTERDICEIKRHVFLLLLVKVDGIIPRDLSTDKMR